MYWFRLLAMFFWLGLCLADRKKEIAETHETDSAEISKRDEDLKSYEHKQRAIENNERSTEDAVSRKSHIRKEQEREEVTRRKEQEREVATLRNEQEREEATLRKEQEREAATLRKQQEREAATTKSIREKLRQRQKLRQEIEDEVERELEENAVSSATAEERRYLSQNVAKAIRKKEKESKRNEKQSSKVKKSMVAKKEKVVKGRFPWKDIKKRDRVIESVKRDDRNQDQHFTRRIDHSHKSSQKKTRNKTTKKVMPKSKYSRFAKKTVLRANEDMFRPHDRP